jgi:acetyltransferase-like isoleucine patch superfamily enzyme
VAAGAVVTHDVADGVTMIGNPARVHVGGLELEADFNARVAV